MPKLYYDKNRHPLYRSDYPIIHDNDMPRESQGPYEGTIPREQIIPKETVYSLDEFNERVKAAPEKEPKESRLKKLFLRPLISIIILGTAFAASYGLDPFGSDFLNKTYTVMTDAIAQIKENPPETSDTQEPVSDDTAADTENQPVTSGEEATDLEPSDEDADIFPTLGNLNPDFAGDYAWSGDGSEEYVRFLGSGESNYTYLVKGSAWDTYDPSGKLSASVAGASYDRGTNTLTLSGFYAGALDINLMGNGFTINLSGDNRIDNISIWGAMYGGSVTFTGDGSLTVSNGILLNCEGSESCMMVKKGVTLDLYGEPPIIIGDSTMKETLYLSKSLKVTGGTLTLSNENEFDGKKMYTYQFLDDNGKESDHIKIEPKK
ncbi:MAG: hypothetical protein K6F76_01410 [Clostridiales bacterium]|nr:hypothetical protein [Clostridiales bacterium]